MELKLVTTDNKIKSMEMDKFLEKIEKIVFTILIEKHLIKQFKI